MRKPIKVTYPDKSTNPGLNKIFTVEGHPGVHVLFLGEEESNHDLWWVEDRQWLDKPLGTLQGFPFCTLKPGAYKEAMSARRGSEIIIEKRTSDWFHCAFKGLKLKLKVVASTTAPKELILSQDYCPRCGEYVEIDSPCSCVSQK